MAFGRLKVTPLSLSLCLSLFHRISFDEGRQWTRHSFSMVPLFVDGVLVETGAENQIMT